CQFSISGSVLTCCLPAGQSRERHLFHIGVRRPFEDGNPISPSRASNTKEDCIMPEAKGRRDIPPLKARAKDQDGDAAVDTVNGAEPLAPAAPLPYNDDNFTGGFDEETNNRYEEIKRGPTHISELQQMTMPPLLKTAKDEG